MKWNSGPLPDVSSGTLVLIYPDDEDPYLIRRTDKSWIIEETSYTIPESDFLTWHPKWTVVTNPWR